MKYIITISIISLLLHSCSSKKETAPTAEPEQQETIVTLTNAQFKNAAIVTGSIAQKTITSTLQLNGKIDVPPQNLISISVPLGGYLKYSKLLPGMHVAKGEVLAIMEDQQYIQLQQDYLTAKANINFLENEYQRQKELNKTQSSSDKAYQKAEADFRSQQVLVHALTEKLSLVGIQTKNFSNNNIVKSINIYSPIDGYVSKINVNIGKYISPTEVMFELINPTDIHLALTVFEKDINKLFIGQKLTCYTNSQPSLKHPATIILIGQNLTQEHSTEVHCHFEDYDKTLLPGTYMNALVDVKNKNVLAIPNDAVVRFEGKQYVFKVVTDKKYEMVEVTIGETMDDFTEIISPAFAIEANTQFVTKGAYTLLMMLKNKEE
jgi:membrane fusion protein, heavy metal efflux system